MKFTSPLWHPNIYPDGKVCISILHSPGEDRFGYEKASERWSPVQRVEKVLMSVISMLAEPNDMSPANVEAAKQWRNDKIVVREKGQGFPHKEHLYIGAMDKVFILNSNKKTDLTDENNFSDVDTEHMSDAQLSRAFINNQTSRKKDRVFVNKFMEMVA